MMTVPCVPHIVRHIAQRKPEFHAIIISPHRSCVFLRSGPTSSLMKQRGEKKRKEDECEEKVRNQKTEGENLMNV